MINVTKKMFEDFYMSSQTAEQFAADLNATLPVEHKKREEITVADIRSACKMYGLDLRKRPRGKQSKFNFVDLDNPEEVIEREDESTQVETWEPEEEDSDFIKITEEPELVESSVNDFFA